MQRVCSRGTSTESGHGWLDGRWIRTIQNRVRSEAQCFEGKNTSASAKRLHQQVNLTQGAYTVELLAFTDCSDISENDDIVPYAERAVREEPTGNNAISSPTYQGSVLTYVNIDEGNRLYYFVTGTFQVQQGESGDWFVGVRVRANKTAYVASLSCLKQ